MHTFTDNTGQSWDIVIDLPTAKRLRNHDLDLFDQGTLERLDHPIEFVDALYLTLEPAAEALRLTDESFAGRLHDDEGAIIQSAGDAWFAELADFFHQHGYRALSTITRKIWTTATTHKKTMASKVDSDKMDAALLGQMQLAERETDLRLELMAKGLGTVEIEREIAAMRSGATSTASPVNAASAT